MKKIQRYLALAVMVCLAVAPISAWAEADDGHFFKGSFTSIMCQLDSFTQDLAMASGEVRGMVAISAFVDCQTEIGEDKFPSSPMPTIYFAIDDLTEDSIQLFYIYEDATWIAILSKEDGYLYVGELEEPLSTSATMLEMIFSSLKENGSIAYYQVLSTGELLDAVTTINKAIN